MPKVVAPARTIVAMINNRHGKGRRWVERGRGGGVGERKRGGWREEDGGGEEDEDVNQLDYKSLGNLDELKS